MICGLLHSISDEIGLPSIEGISITGSAPDSNMKSKNNKSETKALSETNSEFDSSNDENFMTQAQTPGVTHHQKLSSSQSEHSKPLFGSQSKSSTKEIREAFEKYADKLNSQSEQSIISDSSSEKVSNKKADESPKRVKPKIARRLASKRKNASSSDTGNDQSTPKKKKSKRK